MKPFFSALAFLTIIPLPGRWKSAAAQPSAFAASTYFFPVVGIFIGLLAAAGARLFTLWFTPGVCAWLLVLLLLLLTGGLHIDGLADTADGFFSSRPKAGVLEIMKDSRIGAMGAVALIGVLGLKVTALASLPASQPLWIPAFLMPVAGRCAMTMVMVILPDARAQSSGLAAGLGKSRAAGAFALVVLLTAAWLSARAWGWWAAIAALTAAGLLAAWSRRKIGGITGDVLGATCELAEAAVALIFSSTALVAH